MSEIANTKRSSEQVSEENAGAKAWLLKLFGKSVLKQAKLAHLTESLDSTEGLRCLDLGSDNGVISYLLRERGGHWCSADLSEETVSSIRSLVRDDVYLIDGVNFPFDDESFDVIIVVDMLEHLEDDKQFMNELDRILKPGGRIILNTPNHKPFSPLRGFRELIGQGDAEHGHVRAGYSLSDVEAILPRTLEVIKTWTYSRIFSESIDTAIVCAYRIISARKKPSNLNDNSEEQVSKGLVITEEKLKSFEKSFALYSKIYPLVKAVSLLDKLIPFVPGFMRLVVLKKN